MADHQRARITNCADLHVQVTLEATICGERKYTPPTTAKEEGNGELKVNSVNQNSNGIFSEVNKRKGVLKD